MDNTSIDDNRKPPTSSAKRGSSLDAQSASALATATLSFLSKTASCMSLAVLKRFPPEIFAYIFKWLDRRDKLSLSATALFFNRMARNVYVVTRSVAVVDADVMEYLQKIDPAILREGSRLTPVSTNELVLYIDSLSVTWPVSNLFERFKEYKTLRIWPRKTEAAKLGDGSYIKLPYCKTLRVLDTPYLLDTIDLSEYDTRPDWISFPVVFPSRVLDCNIRFQLEQVIFNSGASRLFPSSSDLFVLGVTNGRIERALNSRIKYTRLVITLFMNNLIALERAGSSLASLSTVHFVDPSIKMTDKVKALTFIDVHAAIRLYAPTSMIYVPFSIITLQADVLSLIKSNSMIWCLSHSDIERLYAKDCRSSLHVDLLDLGALGCPVVRDEVAGYEVRPFKRSEYTHLLKHAYNDLSRAIQEHAKSRFECALEKANALDP